MRSEYYDNSLHVRHEFPIGFSENDIMSYTDPRDREGESLLGLSSNNLKRACDGKGFVFRLHVLT